MQTFSASEGSGVSNSLVVFAAAATLTVASPGPTSLLALNNGARWGLPAAMPGIAGAVMSDLVLIASVALGLGTLVGSNPWVLELLRWCGVSYLALLGVQMVRSSFRFTGGINGMAVTAPGSGRSVFLRSFTVAVSNPKGYLFFLALLPMFMDVKANALPQYLLLAVTFASIDALVLLAYASAGAFGIAHFAKTQASPLLDRCSGVALLGMSMGLAVWTRN